MTDGLPADSIRETLATLVFSVNPLYRQLCFPAVPHHYEPFLLNLALIELVDADHFNRICIRFRPENVFCDGNELIVG